MRNEKEIKNLMEKLGITREEAEELWDFDNGNCENETVNKLTEQAKTVKRYEKSDKPRKKATRERKVDEMKASLIDCIKDALLCTVFGSEYLDVENLEIISVDHKLSFTIGKERYSITVTKHRK